MNKDIDFVRLNLDPLATTIQANARAWVKELGKFLNESAREDLNGLKGEIEVCSFCGKIINAQYGARIMLRKCCAQPWV